MKRNIRDSVNFLIALLYFPTLIERDEQKEFMIGIFLVRLRAILISMLQERQRLDIFDVTMAGQCWDAIPPRDH